jgi:hypothetical protein
MDDTAAAAGALGWRAGPLWRIGLPSGAMPRRRRPHQLARKWRSGMDDPTLAAGALGRQTWWPRLAGVEGTDRPAGAFRLERERPSRGPHELGREGRHVPHQLQQERRRRGGH